MKKKEFQSMSLSKQVEFINDGMREGKSLTSICKEIGISKSIGGKFKKHHYVLEDNQYILKPIEGQIDMLKEESQSTEKKVDEVKEVTVPIREPQSEEKPQKVETEQYKPQRVTEPKAVPKRGRPQRELKGRKHTVFVSDDTWKALQLQALNDNESVAAIVERALKNVIRKDTWELFKHMKK